MQAFRRNVLGICESSVKERTVSEHKSVLYNYPPNLTPSGAADEIDGIEIIEVEVNFSSSDGKVLKTVIKVSLKYLFSCVFTVCSQLNHAHTLRLNTHTHTHTHTHAHTLSSHAHTHTHRLILALVPLRL